MIEKSKSKPPSIAAAGRVAQRVELVNIRLVQSAFTVSPKYVGGEVDASVRMQAQAQVIRRERLIQALARYYLIADTLKPKAPAFRINAFYLLRYTVGDMEGLSASDIDDFADINGVFNSWPYWREYVQSVSCRMGLPIVTLPVYRVGGGEDESEPVHSVSKSRGVRRAARQR
jgi:hypothetical protein